LVSITAFSSEIPEILYANVKRGSQCGRLKQYGTQVLLNKETGDYELHETIEPAYLDYRRAKEGMEPINDYLAHWGARFNVPQKSK